MFTVNHFLNQIKKSFKKGMVLAINLGDLLPIKISCGIS